MTLPIPPEAQAAPAPPPMQAPVAPPIPFVPRANDIEPAVALATVKRLSKLMFDPRFQAQPIEWRNLVNDKYMTAFQVVHPPAPVDPATGQPMPAGPPGKGGAPQQPKTPKIHNTGAAPVTSPQPL